MRKNVAYVKKSFILAVLIHTYTKQNQRAIENIFVVTHATER